MKTLYVAFKKVDGNYGTCIVNIDGKINHNTIKDTVKQKIQNYTNDIIIISWQEENE